MCTLPLLAGENVGTRFVVPTVAGCIDLVVHVATERDGRRRVREIVAVPGRVEGDVVETADIFVDARASGWSAPTAGRRTPTGSSRAGFDLPRCSRPTTGATPDGRPPRAAARHRAVPRSGGRSGRRARRGRRGATRRDRVADMLARPASSRSRPARSLASCVGVGGVRARRDARRVAVAGDRAGFGVIAAYAPVGAGAGAGQRQRRAELRDLWPEVVDNLASGVRAGLSLPEALTQLGERGPEELRRPFARFGEDYRATGRFYDCLDRLKASLADPVGDRIVESLRMAREVGGTDLGRLLRTLSAFLREDARTRAELETRQGWTVNAARLAVAAPWIVLALLSLRPEAVGAYNSPRGSSSSPSAARCAWSPTG